MQTTTTHQVIDAVPGGSRALPVTVVRPSEPGPWPGVVMIHEAWGLDDVLVRQAHHLASKGYVVAAPDLFSDGPTIKCLVASIRALTAGQGKPFADVSACQNLLRNDDGCSGTLGVIGFCMGGGFALLLASRGFSASAVNYAMLPKDLDGVLEGACPIVASYGGKDNMLKGAAATLETGLTKAGTAHDVKEYPNAGHAFLNDAMSGPRLLRPLLKVAGAGPEPASAADAWGRIEAFFAAHLAAAAPTQNP